MKQQILFVGKERTIFQSIQSQMQSERIDVIYEASSSAALESTLKYEYCLLIMSLRLTEASDVEMLRIIRTAKRMPIIVLTDKLTTYEKVTIFQSGANAYIKRPIDFTVCAAQANSLIQLYFRG